MDWIYIVMGESEPIAAFLDREEAENYRDLESKDIECYVLAVPLWKCRGKDAHDIEDKIDKFMYDKMLNTEIYPGKWQDICKEAHELRQKLLAEVMK